MRPRSSSKSGMIAAFTGLDAREDGKFTKGMAATLKQAFDAITNKLNGYLTLGDGEQGGWTGNLDGYVKDFTFPSVANTEAAILHELGRPPRFVIVAMQDRAGDVYASNYSAWGPQKIFMKASVADIQVTLLMF